jgi:hypothetical protein
MKTCRINKLRKHSFSDYDQSIMKRTRRRARSAAAKMPKKEPPVVLQRGIHYLSSAALPLCVVQTGENLRPWGTKILSASPA